MKKGQVEIAFFIVGLVVIVGGMAYGGAKISEKGSITGSIVGSQGKSFIGDLDTHLVYNINKCDTNHIKNKVVFNTLKEAHNFRFENAPDCV